MNFAFYKVVTFSRRFAGVLFALNACALLLCLFLLARNKENLSYRQDKILLLSRAKPAPRGLRVAVGCAITSAGLDQDDLTLVPELMRDTAVGNLVFFPQLLVSFCRTASLGFSYRFYLAYDNDDVWFTRTLVRETFQKIFQDHVTESCARETGGIDVDLRFVACAHSGAPAWAQNDAMMAAYEDERVVDYFYRVNDDTVLLSVEWTESYIEALGQFYPPNIGVVGPTALNSALLAYDFVHRTHIDIFRYYYPREFRDWYADRWITHVYQPRTVRLTHVMVQHTRQLKTRYHVSWHSRRYLNGLISSGRTTVSRWVVPAELHLVNKSLVHRPLSFG